MELEVIERDEQGRAIVSVSGEVDLLTAPVLRERMTASIESNGGDVVLDLSGVTFLDSSGLGVILGAHRRLRERDGTLQIVATAPAVLKILTLTGLDKVFDVFDSVEDALAASPA